MVKEWLLLSSLSAFAATSYYLGGFPQYTQNELVPIFLLFALFIVIKGIENSNLLLKSAILLERGNRLPLKLVLITFLLSMVVTIDVALITMLPIVFSLKIREKENIVVLVGLTAHAGAALMPFGTPQNLFIYSFYNIDTLDFISTIAPFSFGMLLLFSTAALFMKTTPDAAKTRKKKPIQKPIAVIYLVLLAIVVAAVLRILPVAAALLALLFALFFDRRSLRVDYSLLLTFLLFLGLTTNIKMIIGGMIHHPGHIFLLSSVMSQFISNVPTTLLLNKFTTQWEALLWGTNVGGFGSLIAALANLITYRLYVSYTKHSNTGSFVLKFLAAGYISFAIGTALYFLLFK